MNVPDISVGRDFEVLPLTRLSMLMAHKYFFSRKLSAPVPMN